MSHSNQSTKTLLLVEDEVIIAESEKMGLEELGYAVIHVSRGEAAVETALDAASAIDLILMDINLGRGMNGTEAAKQILAVKEIPIVFLSSHTEPDVVRKTEQITSYGCVIKNAGMIVLDASIKMAFRLFNAKMAEVRHEEALRVSEEKYRTLVNSTLQGVVIAQANPVRLVFANPAMKLIFGYEADELTTMSQETVARLIYEDDRESFFENFQNRLKGEKNPKVNEYRIHCKDGSLKWVLIHSSRIEYFHEPATLSAFVDITDRKMMEEKLIENKELYRKLILTVPDVIVLTDVDGNITFVNDAVSKLQPFLTSNDLIGKRIESFLAKEDLSRAQENRKQRFDKNIGPQEYRFDFNEGRCFYFEINGEVLQDANGQSTGMVYVLRNIEKRKKAEINLLQSEARFRALHNASFGGIGIHDHGRILECNRGLCEMMGYTYDELIGMNGLLLISESRRDAVVDKIRSGYEEPYDAIAVRKNGETFPVRLEARNIPYQGKQVRVVEFRDLTESKLAEETIKRQLQEKEVLLLEAHHRIKNNITMIKSLLSIQAGETSNPDTQTGLQEAINRVESMRAIYEKLLKTEDYKDVSVQEYFKDLISAIMSIYPENTFVAIHLDIDDFMLDTKKLFPLALIMNELVTNSVKYGLHKGTNRQLDIRLKYRDRHVVLVVKDNGPGFPDQFDLETKAGFGLKLVKILAEQLRGHFEIVKEQGAKCIFSFDI